MKFEDQLQAVAEVLSCNFTLKGEPIAMEKVFAVNGLLPAIMRRADQLSSFCMGYGLGVTFEKAEGGILGVTVEFNDKVPTSLRLLCATDVLIEIVQGAPSTDNVVLDELMLE
ncbi:MAG: type IV secretion protein IcmS [Francisellaceae bacterium]|nr:type IV secretion protein IcmS [Francisellaceae bacterium]MBT6206906.1 type IV secretion protein IcmS [Francisellaceae bacterium]MBT6538277.1 type IV secretion protein IcmS [Francisellaceae bacterium]